MSRDRELLARAFVLMDQAFEQPEDQRQGFLSDACGEDEALLAATTALLDADQAAGEFLEQPAGELAAALILASTEDAMLGREFGSFRTTRLIGSGGMGVVYLAERADEEFEQRVAIKCLRVFTADADLETRFRYERQILAGLQHPGIAHLLDGGISEEGVPWFAMEWVDGEPVTQYCDRHRLGVAERINLFLDICAAVSYAHGRLVIHRDLKPSNIFVLDDAQAPGRVKLLDFGVARLVEKEGAERAGNNLSAAYFRRVTPEYAAPEQLTGGSVTTATDVYALGLLLYELLCGKRARDVDDLEPGAAAERIASHTPELPSAVAAGISEPIARVRRHSPRSLSRALTGDIDAIITKALEMQAERRYRSAEALAVDLQRHLRNEPVRARGQLRAYRLGRFLVRYRWAVGAIFAIVLLLAALSLTMVRSNVQIREALDSARLEAAKARETAEFLQGMFEVLDPNVAPGKSLTVEQLLQRGADRITRELAGQPETLSPLLYELARIHNLAGLNSRADELLDADMGILRSLHGSRHPDIAQRLHQQSIVADALGDFARSEVLAEEALAMRLEFFDRDNPEVGESMGWLGSLLVWGEQKDRAIDLSREAVKILQSSVGSEDDRTQTAKHNLAWMLGIQGHYDEALPLYEEVIEADEQRLGADHTELLKTLSNFAVMLRHMNLLDRAEQISRRVLETRVRIMDSNHEDIAFSQNNLAKLLVDKGQHQEASELYAGALQVFRHNFGERHNTVAITMANLAQVQFSLGNHEQAEQHFRRSLEIHREVTPPGSPKIAGAKLGLGRLLMETGRSAEAEGMLREALKINLQALGEGHWQVAESQLVLGKLLASSGDIQPATSMLNVAEQGLREHFGEDHPLVEEAAEALASVQSSVTSK